MENHDLGMFVAGKKIQMFNYDNSMLLPELWILETWFVCPSAKMAKSMPPSRAMMILFMMFLSIVSC